MAEEGRTIREWASCEIGFDEQTLVMLSQDGSFDEAIVNEAGGVLLLTLRDGRGIDGHDGTWHISIVHDPLILLPAIPTLEHVNDQDKRVRLYTGAETTEDQPFVLTMFQYTATRSVAGA